MFKKNTYIYLVSLSACVSIDTAKHDGINVEPGEYVDQSKDYTNRRTCGSKSFLTCLIAAFAQIKLWSIVENTALHWYYECLLRRGAGLWVAQDAEPA